MKVTKKLVMTVVDVVVFLGLIISGVGVLFGLDGFGMDLLAAFVAFGLAMLLVDMKSSLKDFVKMAGKVSEKELKDLEAELEKAKAEGKADLVKALEEAIAILKKL